MTTRLRLHCGESGQCSVAPFILLIRIRKQLLKASLRLTGIGAGTLMEWKS